MEALTLSGTGLAVAIVMGLLFAFFGGVYWWFFLVGMLVFLLLSAIVTWVGKDYKNKKNLGQDPRGVKNVMANGLMPLLMAGAFWLSMVEGSGYARLFLFGFICAVAAITADKFASEIGVLGPMPISLISGKKVMKGTSGGVTWLGLIVSGLAALIVAVILLELGWMQAGIILAVLVVMASGFAGSVVDSLLGYYEEKGMGNKFTSNFACSVAGAAIGIALLLLV